MDRARYIPYSQESFETAVGIKRVLYFFANWCSTCAVTDTEFSSHLDKIPGDVIVFKVDFDSDIQLKQKYGVTSQHTFILVDQDGNELTLWNGGDLEELIARTQ